MLCSRGARLGARLSAVSVAPASSRSFFDYVKAVGEMGKAKKEPTEQEKELALKQKSTNFGWGWLQWFVENEPEAAQHWQERKKTYDRYQAYSNSAGASGGGTIDFAGFRGKIADPTFVNEMEISHHVDKTTLGSIKDMSTLNGWKPEAIQGFQKECEQTGDLVWQPMTAQERAQQQEEMQSGEKWDNDTAEWQAELQKDYEQFDAELQLFGQHTYEMQLAEHPQYAETIEDLVGSKQSWDDFILFDWGADEYNKRERVAQMQDENRRKAFLERYELGAALVTGE